VSLITTDGQWLPDRSLLSEHKAIARLDRPSCEKSFGDISAGIAAAIASFRPQVVHFASAGLAVYANAIPLGLPRVVTVHGNDLTKPWQRWPAGDVNEAIRNGLAGCRIIFSVSRHTASLLTSAGLKHPVRIIHNSCDFETFAPRQIDREAVLSRHGVDPHCCVLLTVSRLVPRKGHSTVLAALELIDRSVHWLVVGEGRSLELLRNSHARGRTAFPRDVRRERSAPGIGGALQCLRYFRAHPCRNTAWP